MLTQDKNSRKPVLILLRHFPKLKAAEHEVIERLAASATELGWSVHIQNVDKSFDVNEIALVEDEADLVLDIHYEYPKFLKPNSIGAVWTPTSFMKDWDLPYVWENQLSHDNLVHTDSDKIDKLLKSFRPEKSFSVLNHSIPLSWSPWINEATRNAVPKAFYAGINWTKLSGRPGRHNHFFKELDHMEVLDIYGPKKISHVIPWKGFKSYRGEVPFDGKSILRKARESGISLVLSADQHLKEGMISSRLFEGLAASNAIISDRHPFIMKHLGDRALYLDFDRGDEYAANQLREYVKDFQENPSKLASYQKASEEIFASKFNLTTQLSNILNRPIQRKLDFEVDALVIGSSNNDIYNRLKDLNFSKIEFTNSKILDFQDLFEIAKSLDFKDYLVFNANSEFLDNLTERISGLRENLVLQKSKVGILASVLLLQGSRWFQPALVPVADSLPLNGIYVRGSGNFVSNQPIVDFVPSLRLKHLTEISYISPFEDVYSFLSEVGRKVENPQGSSQSVRMRIAKGMAEGKHTSAPDVAEEIRRLPKSRKSAVAFALLAALPGTKLLALVAKWFYRKRST